MVRQVIISLCCLLLCNTVAAQQVDDYRYYKLYEDDTEIALAEEGTDTLFTPKQSKLWYKSLLDNSSAVINNRHGIGYYDRQFFFDGITLPKIGQSRLSRLSLIRKENLATENEHYTSTPPIREQTAVGINLTTRNYLGGVSASLSHALSDRWSLATDLYIRSGRDMHIEGVFTSEASIALSALGRPDSLSCISLLLLFTPSERAGRKAAVAETFTLTGNNYYNPAWGYQNGKVRSADISRTLLPTAAASYKRRLSDKNSLLVSLRTTIGEQSDNSIDWLNAATPLPDNYRKLPSYFYDEQAEQAVTAAWSSNDHRYTQINFDELHRRNALHGDAIYLMSDRVRQITDLQLCAAVSNQINDRAKLYYGLRATYLRSRNFKRATDLLGGGEFYDIDYFLVDDDTFSNMLQNDMQNPDRKVGVSERYGYHYLLDNITSTLFASFDGSLNNAQLRATAEVGAQQISRNGLFQKELFSDNSLGRSRRINFTPWALSAEAQYDLSPTQQLYGHLRAEAVAAEGEQLFLQSQYNNRVVENPTLAKLYTANIGYSLHNHKLAVNANLFLRYNANQTTVSHLYYDAAAEFADVVTSNLNTLCFGLEAEAHILLSKSWRAAAGISVGRYTYSGTPNIKVYADNDNRLLADENIEAARGLHLGQTPQISTFGQIAYSSHGWRVVAEAQYHALRYVSPSLIRRSEAILSHAATEAVRQDFISQQRLDNAFTMNLTLSKSLYLSRFARQIYSNGAAPRFTDRHPHSKITIFLAVNNLLGNSNIYRGYESSRIYKRYLWEDFTATPQPSYLLYAYPRTYYLSVRFSF